MDSKIETMLRGRFPGALVRRAVEPSDAGVGDVLDVFGLESAQVPLLRDFVRATIRPACRAEGVPSPVVLGHSVEETREFYPDAFAEWWLCRWAATAQSSAATQRGATWSVTGGWTPESAPPTGRKSTPACPYLPVAA